MILLIGIILIFFGPSRLPGLGKSMGEAIRGFKKGLDGTGGEEIDVTNTNRPEQLNANQQTHGPQQAQQQTQPQKDKNTTDS
jgi:sec-independent protein translocase protein TatA